MKKAIIVFCAACFLCSLCGCSKRDEATPLYELSNTEVVHHLQQASELGNDFTLAFFNDKSYNEKIRKLLKELTTDVHREYEFVNEEEKAVLEQLRKAVVYYSEHPCVRKDTRGKKRLSELPDAEFLEALKANGLDRKDFPEDLKEEALAALKEEVEFYENHNIPEACGYMDFWNALYSAIHKYYGDEDTSI